MTLSDSVLISFATNSPAKNALPDISNDITSPSPNPKNIESELVADKSVVVAVPVADTSVDVAVVVANSSVLVAFTNTVLVAVLVALVYITILPSAVNLNPTSPVIDSSASVLIFLAVKFSVLTWNPEIFVMCASRAAIMSVTILGAIISDIT